ncbi:MAG: trypsin-like peptidase domain-containing protein [Candidatus Gribaldobacteria bacterium]|nr:trypsin-like peptidase domain-containing protein [Candidatus Gribaldobacteria bacterium]
MHKTFLKIFTLLFVLSLFVIPHGFVFAQSHDPQITSATPSEIRYGDGQDLIINGSNFSDIPGEVITEGSLDLNGHGLSAVEWSDSQIKVSQTDLRRFYEGVDAITDIELKTYYPLENRWVYTTKDVFVKLLTCDADIWTCSDFGVCSQDGTKTRTCTKTLTCPMINVPTPSPSTSQSCTPPCTADTWSCGDWSYCSSYGSQTKSCTKIFDCPTATTPSPATSQSCVYVAPIPSCISFYYSSWSECSQDGKQTRSITSKYPSNCEGGASPKITQSCTYIPSCTADTWTCGAWGGCSLSGIQNRSCNKTFDCPNVQTAPPITDQYCEAPNRPTPQALPSGTDEILNQDIIIKSTVKLLCPVNAQMASQGSGTVIDSSGIILTNKHVVAGTLGCLVGFINDFNDEPYFGERQIADIVKVSPNQDIAILKIRNPQNKKLTSVDTTKGNSNLRLGTKITIYGYPAKFGTKVTYTSGDFSGTDGSYIKTTAILEYGNSGGGSYLKDGTFIGIPSAVVKGELNALGYILSINTINSWLGNSSMAYGDTSNNNYSRVSVLEDIDLNKLGSLKLFIPETDASGNLATPMAPATNQKTQKITEQPLTSQPQKESTIIEPTTTNQKINSAQNNPAPSEKEQKPKTSWIKKLFHWLVKLF